jgi:hypothetical protein
MNKTSFLVFTAAFALMQCSPVLGAGVRVDEARAPADIATPASHPPGIRALVATALAEVAAARLAAHDDKPDELVQNLLDARQVFDLIKAARPTGEVDAVLRYFRAHLSFEDNAQALADLLTLYNTLDAMPASGETTAAREHLQRLKHALQNNNRAGALKELGDVRKALVIDDVDFPLHAADDKLRTIISSFMQNHALPKRPDLLGVETDLLAILNAATPRSNLP